MPNRVIYGINAFIFRPIVILETNTVIFNPNTVMFRTYTATSRTNAVIWVISAGAENDS